MNHSHLDIAGSYRLEFRGDANGFRAHFRKFASLGTVSSSILQLAAKNNGATNLPVRVAKAPSRVFRISIAQRFLNNNILMAV